MSPSSAENVGVTSQPSVGAQAAGLAPVLCSKANNTVGYDSLSVGIPQLSTTAQDTSNVGKEMPVYDIYEEDNSCLHGMDEQLAKRLHKSDNAFSEEATYLAFSHAPGIHGERSIKLQNEKTTQATSILCVHEATVHCHDERPEHISYTNGLETVQLNFAQENILISGAVTNVVNSKALEFVASPSHCIDHAKLRLLWDPGTSASLHSSKANLCNQFGTYGISTDLGFTFSEDTSAVDCCNMPTNTCFSAVRIVDLLYYSQGHGVENRETVQWDPGIGISSSLFGCRV